MALEPGTRIGPYEIVAALGAGGMGEVYRANDTRLDRTVAIKVLAPSLAADPAFRDRFDREARAISALNHPHICTLYDVGAAPLPGASDAVSYLVMEYVEGETLAARLERGALKLNDALRLAMQITDALDKAHRAGIVHRDLKPGNIMLAKSGAGSAGAPQAKLLDFGLAKTVVRPHAQALSDGSHLPTRQAITAQGTILGTFQYMAPEQLEGKDADARTDIFAFGVVLYEMVTGRKAFDGPTQAKLIAAILEHEPPSIATLAPAAPASLDHVVKTCLAKDADDRWQTAGDLKRELKWIAESGAHAVPETTVARTAASRPRRLYGVAAALTLVALAALAGYLLLGRRSVAPRLTLGRTTQVTFDPGLELDPALSPDGKLVAYAAGPVGRTHIYVRQLGATRSIMLTQDLPGYHRWPQWSPDGTKIAFFSIDPRTSARTVSIAPSLGGASKVALEEAAGNTCCATWSPDGRRLAYASRNGIYVRAIDEGAATRLAEHPFGTHSLAWSPDGRRIAYVVENAGFVFGVPNLGNIAPSAIWVVPSSGGSPVQITDRVRLNMSPAWTADSTRLLFISNLGGRRDIYEVALRESGEPAGDPIPLTTGLNALTISLSGDGSKLAYTVYTTEANIWSIPIPARAPTSLAAASPITTGSQTIEGITASPDGKWLAFDSNRNGNQDIYRIPLAGGEIEPLTTNPSDDFLPAWSRDGKEIVFYSWRSGNRDLYVMSADGRSERQLTSDPGHESYPAWSPDGKHIIFRSLQPAGGTIDILTRNADGVSWGSRKTLVKSGGFARWSSDGRFIAYTTGTQLFVMPSGGGSATLLVESKDVGVTPRPAFVDWSRDSRTILYKAFDADARSSFWSVPVTGGPPTLLLKFDDAHASPRSEFATDGARLFFTISRNEADVFVMDVSR